MNIEAFEDIFDVPSSHAGDNITVRLSLGIAELYKVIFGVYPSKFLVHHVATLARARIEETATDDELVAYAIRALSDVVLIGDKVQNTPQLAETIATSLKGVISLKGDDLEAYLCNKTEAKRGVVRASSTLPMDTVPWIDETYLVNVVSGHHVRVKRSVVDAFASVDARSLQAYVSALDARWHRLACKTCAVQTDIGDPWISLACRSVCLPACPDPFEHAGTVYSAVLKVTQSHIALHRGPTQVVSHAGVPAKIWARPKWLPSNAWTSAFVGHLVQHAMNASSDQSKGCQVFLEALMQRMSSRDDHYRRLGTNTQAPHAIVAVDTRPNVMTALSVLVAHKELRHIGFNDVHVVTSPDNVQWYHDRFSEAGIDAKVRTLPSEVQAAPFDVDAYSSLLKRFDFWEHFDPVAKVLVVQDDGFLLDGSGFEQFMNYDYVGAPWAKENLPDLVGAVGDNMVGNGGLSLRSVSMMKRISSDATLKGAMFLKNLMVIPEDVFFTLRTRQLGGSVCQWNKAKGFATEQVLPLRGETTRGLHKVWHYYGADGVRAVFAALPT